MAPGCESTLPAALASFQASPYLFGQLSSVSVYVVTVSRLAQQPTRRAEVSFWDCSIDLISLHTLLVEWHGRGIGLPVGNHAAICFPSTRGRKFGVCGMSTSNREVKVDGEEQASRPASGEIVASLKKGFGPRLALHARYMNLQHCLQSSRIYPTLHAVSEAYDQGEGWRGAQGVG
jgi:hypothetical protein